LACEISDACISLFPSSLGGVANAHAHDGHTRFFVVVPRD
jgi:hypothetical protein